MKTDLSKRIREFSAKITASNVGWDTLLNPKAVVTKLDAFANDAERLLETKVTVLEAEKQLTEKQRVHWWRLACGRLGILYDIMKIQPHNIGTQFDYHDWLEDFILDAIEKLDTTVTEEK